MPDYRVTKTSLFEGRMTYPGSIVSYDGLPGSNLEPLDAAGEKRKKDAEEARKPTTPSEEIGRGMMKGFKAAEKEKAEPSDPTDNEPPKVVLASGDNALTTVGHSSVRQVSSGGVDAQNLLESDGKGGLIPQNPNSNAKPATKADSPDDGEPKMDKMGKPAVTVAGESNAVKRK